MEQHACISATWKLYCFRWFISGGQFIHMVEDVGTCVTGCRCILLVWLGHSGLASVPLRTSYLLTPVRHSNIL